MRFLWWHLDYGLLNKAKCVAWYAYELDTPSVNEVELIKVDYDK
jgi:hypothetical protein